MTTTETTVTATPAKLRNGKWGARVDGTPTVNTIATITTRSGKSWKAYLTRQVWTDGNVSLWETGAGWGAPGQPTAPRTTRRTTEVYGPGRMARSSHRCGPGWCHICHDES